MNPNLIAFLLFASALTCALLVRASIQRARDRDEAADATERERIAAIERGDERRLTMLAASLNEGVGLVMASIGAREMVAKYTAPPATDLPLGCGCDPHPQAADAAKLRDVADDLRVIAEGRTDEAARRFERYPSGPGLGATS